MKATKELNDLFIKEPTFIYDIVHTQFLKTNSFDYYEYAVLNILQEMQINDAIMLKLMSRFNVLNHKVENNEYTFVFEENRLGFKKIGKFYTLWNLILKFGNGSQNIKELLDNLYSSNNSRLIYFVEDLKSWHPSHIEDLFELTQFEECNSSKKWNLTELLDSKWNFQLLALNEKVWQSAFEKEIYFFQPLKNQIESLFIEERSKKSHFDYVQNVNKIIQRLF